MDESDPKSPTGRGQQTPTVTAVVLTWNDTELSTRCIQSLLETDYEPLRILLVDNGSEPPCGETLKRRFPSIEVLSLPKNQGFSGGANRGLERALESGSEYAILLNNDTVVGPTAIHALVAAMAEHPRCAAATPLLLSPGDDPLVGFHTGRIDRNAARHFCDGEDEPLNSREWPTAETEFAPACALMFRAQAIRKIGLFDESLGTNWEDYDLCVRIQDAGWTMLTVGDARVVHLIGATTGRTSPYITYYAVRNRLICLFRYGTLRKIVWRSPFIARTFWWQIRGYGFGNWRCHAAFLKGCLHFLIGVRNEGKPPRQRVDRSRKHD